MMERVFSNPHFQCMTLAPDTNTLNLQSDSISSVSKFKKSGVNKIILLAASPKTPESYANCKVAPDGILNVK